MARSVLLLLLHSRCIRRRRWAHSLRSLLLPHRTEPFALPQAWPRRLPRRFAAIMSDCARCATVQREYEEFQEQSAELEAELERELKTAQEQLTAAKSKLDKVRRNTRTGEQGGGGEAEH